MGVRGVVERGSGGVSEKVDFAQTAAEAVAMIQSEKGWMTYAPNVIAVAEICATLALVEQQRIANVIAVGEHTYEEEIETEWHTQGYDLFRLKDKLLKPEIGKALGL